VGDPKAVELVKLDGQCIHTPGAHIAARGQSWQQLALVHMYCSRHMHYQHVRLAPLPGHLVVVHAVDGDGGVVLAAMVKRRRENKASSGTCLDKSSGSLLHITVQACRGVQRPDESGLGVKSLAWIGNSAPRHASRRPCAFCRPDDNQSQMGG
jgi:hypothetical protein